jgi:hypothetical protein
MKLKGDLAGLFDELHSLLLVRQKVSDYTRSLTISDLNYLVSAILSILKIDKGRIRLDVEDRNWKSLGVMPVAAPSVTDLMTRYIEDVGITEDSTVSEKHLEDLGRILFRILFSLKPVRVTISPTKHQRVNTYTFDYINKTVRICILNLNK